MKTRLHKYQIALSLCVLLSLLMVRPGFAAAPTLIDHFTVAQTLSLTYQGSTGLTVTGNNSVAGANILGGERDLIASVSSANPTNLTDQPYQATVASHSLTISSGTDLLFTTEMQWDGSGDLTKANINPIGLQTLGVGVDLTVGGEDRFIFGLPSSDVGGKFTLRVYTSANECSESVWNFPGAVNAFNQTVIERLYSTFTTICGGYSSLATFTNVGAISLTIETSITSPSLDMSMDLIGQDVAPFKDFGDLPDDGGTAFRYEYFKDVTQSNALHVDTGLTLGASESLENVKRTDGTDNATADTLDNGVTPVAPWNDVVNGGTVSVVVSGCPLTQTNCYLTAFIDWNQDGSFWNVVGDTWQTGERILANYLVTNGTQTVTFDIPTIAGKTDGSFANQVFYARFRVTDTPFNQPTAWGAAFSGEVEDYKWTFGVTAVSVERLTASSPVSPLQPILPFAAALVLALGAGLVGFVLPRKLLKQSPVKKERS